MMKLLLTPVFAAALATAALQPREATAPRIVTMEGQLTRADYERMIEHPFEVPPGVRRVEVRIDVSGTERRTVVDLGLRDPEGLRGWSGGRTNHVFVSRLSASPGYLPGSIPPGTWAVVLGIPNIREGSRDRYTVTVTLGTDESAPAPVVVRPTPGWVVGDLHAHSFHSDGRGRSQSGTLVPVPLHRVVDGAVKARLDFLVVSDHNTASHWVDLDRLQPYYDRILLVHGRELTTYRGHANTVGEQHFTDFRLPAPDASPASVLRPVVDQGAFVSVNHPAAPDDESCMGCGWNVTDDALRPLVHGVEVVNGDQRSGPGFGWPFWAALMNRGWRVTAVGGSDDHTPDDPADRAIGTPATVVWVDRLSEAGLIDGLKSGRVYVRTMGPAGPTLEFTATTDGSVYQMGSEIAIGAPASVELRAEVTGGEGQLLEWIADGKVIGEQELSGGKAVAAKTVQGAKGSWYSLRLRRGEELTLLANAIRLR